MSETIELLLRRRSVRARDLLEPGPEGEDLERILRAGIRVPDHGKLAPWRFLLVRGRARETLGETLAEAYRRANPAASEDLVAGQRLLPLRAPTLVVVVSRPVGERIPEWEQILSCGAACQNMLVAASALGFAGQWLTEWYAYDRNVCRALGLRDEDRIAGFLYLGRAGAPPQERPRPELSEVVEEWTRPA